MEIFKKSKEQIEYEKIIAMPVELDEEDYKRVTEIVNVPQDLMIINNLSPKGIRRFYEAMTEYSQQVTFMVLRQKQVKAYYADSRRRG
jgi:hypothetical protein